ncbi:MAG TPA: hypothetical protein DCM25_00965 [Rhodobacteraceae bacterium]|nr:hypothetical protein [Paracoccaceae bacterium]
MSDTEPTDPKRPLVLDSKVEQSVVIDAEVIPDALAEDLERPALDTQKLKGLLPLFAGGLLVGGIGFGAAMVPSYFNPRDPIAPVLATQNQLSEKIEAQSRELEEIQARPTPVDLSGEVAALADSVIAFRTDLAALKAAQVAQARSLSERIDSLEKRRLVEGVSPLAVAGYERELAQLRENISQLANDATNKIEEAKALAEVIEGNAAKLSRDGMVIYALTAIQAAVESGASYTVALDDLVAATNIGLPTSLVENAPNGVASLSILQKQFPVAARAALKLAREEQGLAEGENGVLAFLKTQLGVRSLNAKGGGSADAVLSRAQAAVDVGDFAVALSEIATLSSVGQDALQGWSLVATLRLQVLAALQEFSSTFTGN